MAIPVTTSAVTTFVMVNRIVIKGLAHEQVEISLDGPFHPGNIFHEIEVLDKSLEELGQLLDITFPDSDCHPLRPKTRTINDVKKNNQIGQVNIAWVDADGTFQTYAF